MARDRWRDLLAEGYRVDGDLPGAGGSPARRGGAAEARAAGVAVGSRRRRQDDVGGTAVPGQVAAGTILELGVPLADLGRRGTPAAVTFVATVCGRRTA